MADTSEKPAKLQFSLDYRLVCLLLMAIIVGMLAWWRPWSSSSDSGRTIQTTGEATIKATPDEFVFYPSYELTADTKQAALDMMTARSNEIINKIKELGVPDEKISTNASNYDTVYYPSKPDGSDKPTYSLQVTVTVNTREQAQKIQDYLLTTDPTGSITPQPAFSDNKRKELENQARDEATKDARAKAEQNARNLGFGIGKVKSVEDGSGFGGAIPLSYGAAEDATSSSRSSLTIQPGENEIRYTVTVTYFLK